MPDYTGGTAPRGIRTSGPNGLYVVGLGARKRARRSEWRTSIQERMPPEAPETEAQFLLRVASQLPRPTRVELAPRATRPIPAERLQHCMTLLRVLGKEDGGQIVDMNPERAIARLAFRAGMKTMLDLVFECWQLLYEHGLVFDGQWICAHEWRIYARPGVQLAAA